MKIRTRSAQLTVALFSALVAFSVTYLVALMIWPGDKVSLTRTIGPILLAAYIVFLAGSPSNLSPIKVRTRIAVCVLVAIVIGLLCFSLEGHNPTKVLIITPVYAVILIVVSLFIKPAKKQEHP